MVFNASFAAARARAGVNSIVAGTRSTSSWTTWLFTTIIPTNLASMRSVGATPAEPKPGELIWSGV